MNNKRLAKNLILSVGAQLVSLLTSFIVGLIVPKYIEELQYSYWQIFLLYYGYVGIFHFGLLDGLILKYSQYDYDQLDKARMRSQFQALLLIISVVTIVMASVCLFSLGGEYVWIGLLISIGVIIKNVFTYTMYTFQMTNRINLYAALVIAQRLLYGILIIGCLLFDIGDFYWFCIADLASELVAAFVASFFNKGLYFGKGLPWKETFRETRLNVSAGLFLMISNLSSMLIVGGAKMVIQWRWDELTFGKLAFSFSVANLFLAFVTAVSVVLFPSLKRMREEEYPQLFEKIRGAMMPILFLVLLMYFPGCWVLKRWLPKYVDSLMYLGILLPLIVFSSKNNLLVNNYLKVYRKEKLMLAVNMGAVGLGFVLFLVGAYGLNSLDWILFFLIAAIMASSIVSEIIVTKILGQGKYFHFVIEFLMTAAFIISARFLSLWIGCAVYAGAFVVYAIIYRKQIFQTLPFFNKKT